MKSIGRKTELQRVARRLDSFRQGQQRSLHMAVAAPKDGGLVEFLDDIIELGNTAGDITVRTALDDHRQPDQLLLPLNRALQKALERPEPPTDGSLQTMMDLLDSLRRTELTSKVLLVADVSLALQALQEKGPMGGGISDPLLARLRALANKIEDDELPLALIVGWYDDFPSWAPQLQAGDVIDRYAPSETLFADYGLGRNAWPIFKEVFAAADVKVNEELPGICGSGLPAGAFAVAARHAEGLIDGMFVLDFLRKRARDQTLGQIASGVDDNLFIRLCLKDEFLPADSELGSVVEPRSEGGYVATRELYAALGLAPPREIVSFADQVRQRLEDHDPELEREIASALAGLLADGRGERLGRAWRLKAAPKFKKKHPLGELDVLLLVSLESGLDSAQKEEALTFASEAERSAEGLTKLIIIVCYGTRFETQVRRELFAGLTEMGIVDPRPRREEESPTQGRFLAVLCMLELTTDQVVTAARLGRDPSNDGGLGDDFVDKLAQHYRTVQRKMPLLRADSVQASDLGRLISAAGDPVDLVPSTGAVLSALGIVSKIDSRHYIWRWGNDQLLQHVSDIASADAASMSGYYLMTVDEWQNIGVALSSAYTSDLLVWENSVLKTADPLPLLKQQVQQRIDLFEPLLANASVEYRSDFSRQFEEAIAKLDDADHCAHALEKLADLTAKLESAKKTSDERAARLKNDLNAEISKIADAKDLPSTLAQELSSLREMEVTKQTLEKARGLAVRIDQERDRQRQRAVRLESVSREIRKLPEDKREAATKLLNDPAQSVVDIRAKVEEMRATLPPPRPTPVPPNPPVLQTKTFTNSPEDLAQLAELYRDPRVQILKVEIES